MPLSQPGAASTTPKRRQRAQAPAYPDLLGTDDPRFWLACYLRDCAEQDALEALLQSVGCKHHWAGTPLVNALSEALWKKSDQVRTSAEYIQSDGMLPYAWAGTKAVHGEPA
ncbi:MAG: hypothetical protein DCF26_09520 [Burkholderiales bacterium]|nr:MAG: hypothetical protein DCF26_09520 [Burkholderiales bacterium]